MTTATPRTAAKTPRPRDHGSETVTDGVRITVHPQYLPMKSTPDADQYVFTYHITIRNESAVGVRLLRRHWAIVDADGERHEVDGEGVVGQTPHLDPGESYEYASYCPLPTTWGTMEGAYRMVRDDKTEFDAIVGRFYLVAGDAPTTE